MFASKRYIKNIAQQLLHSSITNVQNTFGSTINTYGYTYDYTYDYTSVGKPAASTGRYLFLPWQFVTIK